MRALLLILSFIPMLALAQQPTAEEDLFAGARPQLQITVAHTNIGADLIDVTALDADYPAELLRLQLARLGELIGSAPRGLAVFPYDVGSGQGKLTFLKATCAVNGIISPEKNTVNLEAFAKAFAGAKKPSQSGEDAYYANVLSITLVNQTPTPSTLKSYKSENVLVQGDVNEQPPFIEYRIKILNQNPKAIQIPLNAEQKVPQKASTVRTTGMDWTLWALVVIAGVAVGALVYSLLLRRAPKPR